MKKLYGSSSAFAWGRLVFTDSKAGCVRAILLQNHGIKEGDIDQKHVIRGALNEQRHEEFLTQQGSTFEREKVIKRILKDRGDDSIEFSGRADFVLSVDGAVSVDELKSTESKYKLRDVIKNGKYTPENLAQVVAYMAALQTATGRLIYTYYEKVNDKYEQKMERAFEILIDDAGRICVDGTPSKYSLYDLLAHQKLVVNHLMEDTVGDRPHNWNQKFGSPCGFCVFRKACDAYDQGSIEQTTDSFCNVAKTLVKEKKPNE